MGEKTYNDIIENVKGSDAKNDWVRSDDYRQPGTSIRFFIDDVNLRFELIDPGSDEEGAYYANRDFKERWANCHADPTAWRYFVRFYYSSTLIKSFILVAVDGGRASLPMPKAPNDLSFDPLDYKVAQIHDEHNNLDEYIRRSKSALSSNNVD